MSFLYRLEQRRVFGFFFRQAHAPELHVYFRIGKRDGDFILRDDIAAVGNICAERRQIARSHDFTQGGKLVLFQKYRAGNFALAHRIPKTDFIVYEDFFACEIFQLQ